MPIHGVRQCTLLRTAMFRVPVIFSHIFSTIQIQCVKWNTVKNCIIRYSLTIKNKLLYFISHANNHGHNTNDLGPHISTFSMVSYGTFLLFNSRIKTNSEL